MVLLFLCGIDEGCRSIRLHKKRRRCYLSTPPWFEERVAELPGLTPAGKSKDQVRFQISAVARISPGRCFSGALHCWGDMNAHLECELLRDRLWNPRDAFNVVVEQIWRFNETVPFRHVQTAVETNVQHGIRHMSASCNLFRPTLATPFNGQELFLSFRAFNGDRERVGEFRRFGD